MLTFFPQLEQITLAKIAYDSELFIKGFTLENYYQKILNLPVSKSNFSIGSPQIILGFNGIVPISVFLIEKESNQINIFIKDGYRGKGIGSELLKHSLKSLNLRKNEIFGSFGLPGSQDFYLKNDIPYFNLFTDEEFSNFLTLYEKKLIASGVKMSVAIKDKIQTQYEKQRFTKEQNLIKQ